MDVLILLKVFFRSLQNLLISFELFLLCTFLSLLRSSLFSYFQLSKLSQNHLSLLGIIYCSMPYLNVLAFVGIFFTVLSFILGNRFQALSRNLHHLAFICVQLTD